MTPKAIFLRLLDTPISEKGTRLRQQIANLNTASSTADVFPADPTAFAAIPGSPFAYWFNSNLLNKFNEFEPLESNGRVVRVGLQASDDFRFLRCWWEVNPDSVANKRQQTFGCKWVNFAKGGGYSPYYYDLHLVVDWNNDGEVTRESGTAFIRNENFYFSLGLTYPRLPHKRLSVRILPEGCIFSVNGPSIFWTNNKVDIRLLAVLNSNLLAHLLMAGMGRGSTEASGQTMTVQVGFFQTLPICDLEEIQEKYVRDAFDLVRLPFSRNEITHVFCLPILMHVHGAGIAERLAAIAQSETERRNALAALQSQIDTRIVELYGVPEFAEVSELKIENINPSTPSEGEESAADEEEAEGEVVSLLSDSYSLISDLLMWCVGVAFGRWDVRYALNPTTLPALPEPFAPLPVCSPGMLQGKDGLPLHEVPKFYPIPISSHGFLVDDPDRPQDDIVAAVRRVFHLLFGVNAESIENEACQILEVPNLRTWFRDPKGFFAWHIKRYSKSRRKAPIYWLIQTAKKNYAVWLYYPRLNPDSLFFAAREYADAKINLENTRLDDLQNNINSFSGSNRKVQEKKLAVQTALVAELKSYIKKLDAAALLQINPDLNDGVLLNIAPLRDLVPWKEPSRAWDELLHGKYSWSHVAFHLRQKGLVRGI